MNSNWLSLLVTWVCGWCVFRVAGCNSPLTPFIFIFTISYTHSNLKSLIHYSSPLKSFDFFRFLGPKRVGLWGWDLLATADAWIQESRSLAEVSSARVRENPVKRWAVHTRTCFLWCFEIFMMLVVYSCLDSMFGWMLSTPHFVRISPKNNQIWAN